MEKHINHLLYQSNSNKRDENFAVHSWIKLQNEYDWKFILTRIKPKLMRKKNKFKKKVDQLLFS